MPEKMPEKSLQWLEEQCIKALQFDPHTRSTTRVTIIRLTPEGSGPNWALAEIDPSPTQNGWRVAHGLVAQLTGTYALAPD